MSKRLVVIIITIVFSVFGIFQFYQHKQLQETLSLERERAIRTRFAVTMLRGVLTTWEDEPGFSHIEYYLNNNYAIINLAGLKANYDLSKEEVLEALIDIDHPKHVTVFKFMQRYPRSGRSMFSNELNKIWLRDYEDIISRFPDLELCTSMRTCTLPIPVLHELIRLEAEQQ